MNWFTWIVVIVGVLLAAALLHGLLRPTGGFSRSRREDDMGEALIRGGLPTQFSDGHQGGL